MNKARFKQGTKTMMKNIVLFFGFISLIVFYSSSAFSDSIILSPCDFNQAQDDNDYLLDLESLYVKSGSSTSHFYAPVHLPQNAQVTSVVLFYKDNHSSGNIQIKLLKINAYTEAEVEMAEFTSSGSSSERQTHKITPITGGYRINNTGYVYNCYLNFTDSSADDAVKVFLIKINYVTS